MRSSIVLFLGSEMKNSLVLPSSSTPSDTSANSISSSHLASSEHAIISASDAEYLYWHRVLTSELSSKSEHEQEVESILARLVRPVNDDSSNHLTHDQRARLPSLSDSLQSKFSYPGELPPLMNSFSSSCSTDVGPILHKLFIQSLDPFEYHRQQTTSAKAPFKANTSNNPSQNLNSNPSSHKILMNNAIPSQMDITLKRREIFDGLLHDLISIPSISSLAEEALGSSSKILTENFNLFTQIESVSLLQPELKPSNLSDFSSSISKSKYLTNSTNKWLKELNEPSSSLTDFSYYSLYPHAVYMQHETLDYKRFYALLDSSSFQTFSSNNSSSNNFPSNNQNSLSPGVVAHSVSTASNVAGESSCSMHQNDAVFNTPSVVKPRSSVFFSNAQSFSMDNEQTKTLIQISFFMKSFIWPSLMCSPISLKPIFSASKTSHQIESLRQQTDFEKVVLDILTSFFLTKSTTSNSATEPLINSGVRMPRSSTANQVHESASKSLSVMFNSLLQSLQKLSAHSLPIFPRLLGSMDDIQHADSHVDCLQSSSSLSSILKAIITNNDHSSTSDSVTSNLNANNNSNSNNANNNSVSEGKKNDQNEHEDFDVIKMRWISNNNKSASSILLHEHENIQFKLHKWLLVFTLSSMCMHQLFNQFHTLLSQSNALRLLTANCSYQPEGQSPSNTTHAHATQNNHASPNADHPESGFACRSVSPIINWCMQFSASFPHSQPLRMPSIFDLQLNHPKSFICSKNLMLPFSSCISCTLGRIDVVRKLDKSTIMRLHALVLLPKESVESQEFCYFVSLMNSIKNLSEESYSPISTCIWTAEVVANALHVFAQSQLSHLKPVYNASFIVDAASKTDVNSTKSHATNGHLPTNLHDFNSDISDETAKAIVDILINSNSLSTRTAVADNKDDVNSDDEYFDASEDEDAKVDESVKLEENIDGGDFDDEDFDVWSDIEEDDCVLLHDHVVYPNESNRSAIDKHLKNKMSNLGNKVKFLKSKNDEEDIQLNSYTMNQYVYRLADPSTIPSGIKRNNQSTAALLIKAIQNKL